MRNILWILLLLMGALSLCAQNESERHYNIDGVRVHAGVNPADLLMERAYALRDTNSAYRCRSFRYVAYQKARVMPTYLSDSLESLRERPLFISESVSEVLFKQPGRKYEKLVASKTSGLENPIFNMMLSRIQFQNLYESDFVKIMEVDYVSPLSKGATKRYEFRLADTVRTPSDTFFVIAYEPKYGLTFKSLKGVLHLDSATSAVRHIEAVPVDKNVMVRLQVTHDYEKQENGCWFPQQMSAEFKLPRLAQGNDTLESKAVSTITLRELQINPELRNRDFGLADLEEEVASVASSNALLSQYRLDTLTDKEERTYELVDSISHGLKLDKRLRMLPSLAMGYIPIGPIDVDIPAIVNYTYYEGWRFGLGLYTNQRLMRFGRVGGYFAYGLKDKSWKWGASMDWELERRHSVLLKVRYYDDIVESGGLNLLSRDEMGLLNGEFYRHWIINKFDRSRTVSGKLQVRASKSFTFAVGGGWRSNKTLFDYGFRPWQENASGSFAYQYGFVNAGVRFAFRESTFRTSDLTFYTPSKYPTLQLTYECGFVRHETQQMRCDKLNLRIHHLQRYKILGYSELAIDGGWISRSVPYSLLYVMPAGYEKIGFYGKEQFAVMRPNEFVADSYVALFFRHNFGKMWEGRFQPRIVLCQNIGFGWLNHAADHLLIDAQGMEKGYYETGLMIDNLLSAKDLLAMGVGFFYRYGPYGSKNFKDNYAIKVSLTIPMAE